MKRKKFVNRMNSISEPMSEKKIKEHIATHHRPNDMAVCAGELAELSLELTRFQRGKMNPVDFLQELAHVQWAVWSLQNMFGIEDANLRRAIQASIGREDKK